MKTVKILFLLFCVVVIWQEQFVRNDSCDSFVETDSFSTQESWVSMETADFALASFALEEVIEDQDVNFEWMKNRRRATFSQFNCFVSSGYTNRELTSLLLLQCYTNLPPPINCIKSYA